MSDASRTIDPVVQRCNWPDRLWLWRDRHGSLQATEGKPSRETASREYGKFLSKEELFKLAEKDDGIDTGRYVNNLLRIIDNQTKEINRLRERIESLHEALLP